MEHSRKSEASRTVRVEGFQQLIEAIDKLSDNIVKPDEAMKWQIVAWKTFLQLSKAVVLEEFVKSSIVELEKLNARAHA